MIKVLMVGNDKSVKGGITTVINQFKEFDWRANNINFKFIPTYVDKNNVFKILFFIFAYIRIFIYFIFVKPDIIHIHMSYRGSFTRAYIIQQLAIKFCVKNIIHLHGSEFKKWYDELDKQKKINVKKLLLRSDRFIVLGENWYKIIKEIVPDADVVILNNSIKIPNKKTRYQDNKTFIFLGVLIKRKGVHDLIEALSKLDLNNYQLLIAGTGEEENNLKELVSKYRMDDRVKFLGWIDFKQKEELLLNTQFMVLPSYNEGLPMSILEAMSYGIPILSTTVGDIPSVVNNGESGYLYNSGDIKSLAKYLEKAINLNEDEWNRMSAESFKICKNKFSNVVYLENIIDIYKKMVI